MTAGQPREATVSKALRLEPREVTVSKAPRLEPRDVDAAKAALVAEEGVLRGEQVAR